MPESVLLCGAPCSLFEEKLLARQFCRNRPVFLARVQAFFCMISTVEVLGHLVGVTGARRHKRQFLTRRKADIFSIFVSCFPEIVSLFFVEVLSWEKLHLDVVFLQNMSCFAAN